MTKNGFKAKNWHLFCYIEMAIAVVEKNKAFETSIH